jgi:hypothetical protein
MANLVLEKFGTATAITITLGSLANSGSRQGTIVDNTTNRYSKVEIAASIKMGSSPGGSTLVTLYLIRDDGTGTRTDSAGASDAAITLLNAQTIGTLSTKVSPSTGDVLSDLFVVYDPGPKWTIAVLNGTGVSLDSTNANHVVEYTGINPEIQ